jgi:RNA polymerase sigma factor (sigma-70 family)
MPPSAEGFAPRLIIRPALRSQSDRRLVTLVREGYEVAFEEIVRRYGRPLGRYAATIVGGRSEDVTQDAFSKALLALRRTDAEIELRPWLYRIVRNTALNDLRDRLPVSELADTLPASGGPAEQVEQREELLELTRRLQALPDPQRAAIVMRELEGLGHDEIAAALGLSGGAARQAIYRARATLRDGLGMLVPLPLIKALLSEDLTRHAEIATGAIGSAGTGVALKATAATLLVAGTVGAGVVLHGDPGATESAATAHAAATRHAGSGLAGHRAGQSLREDPGGATSSQARHRGSEGHGAGHAATRGEGAGGHGHGISGGQHSTEGQSSPSGHDGGGSDSHSTSGGDHSGSGSGKSGSGSGDSSVSGSSGSGDSGSGRDSGSGDISGSSESSGSDSGSSGDGGSTESTEATPGGSGSTSDGISGDSRDSSSGDGLIEEMSPLN